MNKYIVEPITVKMPSGNTAPGGNRVTTRIVPKQGQNIIAGNFTINKQRGYAIGLPGFVRHNSITFFEEPASNIYIFKTPTGFDADGVPLGFDHFGQLIGYYWIEEIQLTEIYNQTSNFPMYIKVDLIFVNGFDWSYINNYATNFELKLDFDYNE